MTVAHALANVRAARVFAEDARRRALAELEILLTRQLESERDTIVRGAAWLTADNSFVVADAERRRQHDEEMAEQAPNPALYDRILRQALTSDYRLFMQEVVKLLDPHCAGGQPWNALYAQALRAEGL